jgi:hypothetical protein
MNSRWSRRLADDMPAQGGDPQAIITPATDIAAATNCDSSGLCREVALYFRSASGDTYVAYDFVQGRCGNDDRLENLR